MPNTLLEWTTKGQAHTAARGAQLIRLAIKSMNASQQLEYCLRAIAYLKVVAPDDGTEVVALSREDSPVLKDIGHRLLVGYIVDEGKHYSYVQQKHLDAAGISADALHVSAIKNLSAIAEQKLQVKTHGNIYVVLMGGDFEASLILVPEFWSTWYSHLSTKGFVAAFPARDLLAFGDSTSSNVISELQALCERALESETDHPLTYQLFTNVGGSWRPYG